MMLVIKGNETKYYKSSNKIKKKKKKIVTPDQINEIPCMIHYIKYQLKRT